MPEYETLSCGYEEPEGTADDLYKQHVLSKLQATIPRKKKMRSVVCSRFLPGWAESSLDV